MPVSVIVEIGSLAQVDEAHVGEVVGLVVVGVETGPLRADVVVRRAECLGDRRGRRRSSGSCAWKKCRRVSLLLRIDHRVVERAGDSEQFAALPTSPRTERCAPPRTPSARPRSAIARGTPARRPARRFSVGVGIGCGTPPCRSSEIGTVASGDREVRGALEDGELRASAGDQRDRLDRRRPGADHGDSLAGEVHAVVRPCAGEVHLALRSDRCPRCRAPSASTGIRWP